MTESLQKLLVELEQFGLSNDATIADRPQRMLNITRDTGEFLSVLVRSMNAQRVLEIGTSNGYSTLWLAFAARAVKGHVTTVELSDFKLSLAAKNFERSGLAPFITQVKGEAGAMLTIACSRRASSSLRSRRGPSPIPEVCKAAAMRAPASIVRSSDSVHAGAGLPRNRDLSKSLIISCPGNVSSSDS